MDDQEKEQFYRELAKANRPQPAKLWIIALAIASGLGSVMYHVVRAHDMGGSSAIFVGIPAIIAIALACTPRARTVTGGIMKGITFMLLIVAPMLGEGWFCILIASPIFYVVGLIVGLIADHSRKDRNTTAVCLVLFFIPMSLEGVLPELTFSRFQTVSVTRAVAASGSEVERALNGTPHISLKLPRLLRIGFPVPLNAEGAGTSIGDERSVLFSGVESAPPGKLIMRVGDRRPGYIRFDAISDASKLDHWLHWQDAEVSWKPIDPSHTQVTWQIHFERRLDPAWYFVPWERAAVRAAAGYLIDAAATPRTVSP